MRSTSQGQSASKRIKIIKIMLVLLMLTLSLSIGVEVVIAQQGIPMSPPSLQAEEDPRTVDRQIAQQAVDMLADQLPDSIRDQFKECVKIPIEAAKDGKVDTKALGSQLASCAQTFLSEAAQVVLKVATCQEVAGTIATAFLWHADFGNPPSKRAGVLPKTGKLVFKRVDPSNPDDPEFTKEFTDSNIAYTYDRSHVLFYYEVEVKSLKHKFVPFRVNALVLPIGWKEISPPPNFVIQACILNVGQVHYTDYFYVGVLGQVQHKHGRPPSQFVTGEGQGWYREFTSDIELNVPLVILKGGSLIPPHDIQLKLQNHELAGQGVEVSSSDDARKCRRDIHVQLQHGPLQLLANYKELYRLELEPREAFTQGGDAIPQLLPVPPHPRPCGDQLIEGELWYEESGTIHLKALEQYNGQRFTRWEIEMLDLSSSPPRLRRFSWDQRELFLEALGPTISRAIFGAVTVTLDSNLCALGPFCQDLRIADLELFQFAGQAIKVKEIPKTLQLGVNIPYNLSVTPIEPAFQEILGVEIAFEGWDDNGDGRIDVTDRGRTIIATASASYKAIFKLIRGGVTLNLEPLCGPATPLAGQRLTGIKVRATPPGTVLTTPTSQNYAPNTAVELEALDLQLVACHMFGAPIPVFFSHWEIDGVAQPTGRAKVTLTLTRDTTARMVYTMSRCAKLETDKKEYQLGEAVTIRLINSCQATLTLSNSAPWVIKDSQGRVVFTPTALQVITEVRSGETKSWQWDQKDNNRQQVPLGTYTVELETMDAGMYSASFEIKAVDKAKLGVNAVGQIKQGPITINVGISVPVLVNGIPMITPVSLQLDKNKPVLLTAQQVVKVTLPPPFGQRTFVFQRWQCDGQTSTSTTIIFTLSKDTTCTAVYVEGE